MKTSAQIRAEINGIDPDLRLSYHRAVGLRGAFEARQRATVATLTVNRGGEDCDNPGNLTATAIAAATNSQGLELAGIRVLLDGLESSQAYSEGKRLLAPLLEELDQALAREAEEAAAVAEAQAAVDAAEAAARAKIEGRIAADPAVTKARQALAGIKRLGQPLEDAEDIARQLQADLH